VFVINMTFYFGFYFVKKNDATIEDYLFL